MSAQPQHSIPIWRRWLYQWRGRRLSKTLWTSNDPEPTLEQIVSQAATFFQCTDPIYARWCQTIEQTPRLDRKQWEFVFLLEALQQSGALTPGKRGLGFGVGREPIAAVTASKGCSILATDLAPEDGRVASWQETGQYGGEKQALNPLGICAQDQFERNVDFAYADMRDLSGLDADFDFLWSSCALEHLGSLGAGLEFIRNSLALLKPGGVAVHTTELNVASLGETIESGPVVLFRRIDLEKLAGELAEAGHSLALNFNTGGEPADQHVDLPPYNRERHLKILYARHATTSFGLVIRKSG